MFWFPPLRSAVLLLEHGLSVISVYFEGQALLAVRVIYATPGKHGLWVVSVASNKFFFFFFHSQTE